MRIDTAIGDRDWCDKKRALDPGMAASTGVDGFSFDDSHGPTRNWVTIAGTTHVLRAVAACGHDATQLRRRFDLNATKNDIARAAFHHLYEDYSREPQKSAIVRHLRSKKA